MLVLEATARVHPVYLAERWVAANPQPWYDMCRIDNW